MTVGGCWCRWWLLESWAREGSWLAEGGGGGWARGKGKREKKKRVREGEERRERCKMNFKILFFEFIVHRVFVKKIHKIIPVSCKQLKHDTI